MRFNAEEEAYRRGYSQGFMAGRNTETTWDEIMRWRHIDTDEKSCPPGSFGYLLEKQKDLPY